MTMAAFWTTIFTITLALAVILNVVAYLILAERKISAYMQDRIGPNRVGPWGILQPIVDGVKMALKEDVTPSHVDKVFFILAPGVACATALAAFCVVGFGPTTKPADATPLTGRLNPDGTIPADVMRQYEESHAESLAAKQEPAITLYETDAGEKYGIRGNIVPGLDIGILLVFAIGSLAVYGIILGGWSANSKYSLLGSLRSSAQIISYEIPLGMSVLGIFLVTGSMNLEAIIDHQTRNGWNFLFQPLAFLIFLTAVFAECNRLPFDLPEAEQELVGGYHTEYSSLKFGLFFLGEYTHMITTSFLCAIMFFGGWHVPLSEQIREVCTPLWFAVIQFGVVCFKASLFIMLFMFVRWTIPRFRFDQLMAIAWQLLIPLSLLNLLCVMLVKFFELPTILLLFTSIGLFALGAWISTRSASSNTPKRYSAKLELPPVQSLLSMTASKA